MSAADHALACATATRDAQALIVEVQTGQAMPDALHVALQGIRATGDGHRLRSFTRAVQKAIESPMRVGQ